MTHLAVVALKVIVLVHRHDPEDLFTALRHTTGEHGGCCDFLAHYKNKCESPETYAR